MQRADLVAVGVAQIGQNHLDRAVVAHAGRIFERGASVGQACGMPGTDAEADALGQQVAQGLIQQGARDWLATC